MGDKNHEYNTLAALFVYPDAEFRGRLLDVQEYLDDACPEASGQFREFAEYASQATLLELEELYTRSFDVQAITTLDLGYVLFGDDYKRGELLVHLNEEHREAGVECGGELPDHLPNMLKLLDAIGKPDLRAELVQKIIGPALRRIIGEFDPDRLEKKNNVYVKQFKTLIDRSERFGTVYRGPLQALYTVLKSEFDVGADREPAAEREERFLNSIKTELRLECNKGKCHGAVE